MITIHPAQEDKLIAAIKTCKNIDQIEFTRKWICQGLDQEHANKYLSILDDLQEELGIPVHVEEGVVEPVKAIDHE